MFLISPPATTTVEVIRATVSIICVLITVFGGVSYKFYLDNKKLKQSNESLIEEIKDLSLSVQIDLQLFNEIKAIVETILYKTKADRFLILTATNGIKDMRFATAIYEQHKNNDKVLLSLGATGKYVKFEFDSHYKMMLKTVENTGYMPLETNSMPDSDLKSIYEAEEIKYSKIFFLMRGKIDDENDRLFYCSVATHSETGFDNSEKVTIKSSIDKLKDKFKNL